MPKKSASQGKLIGGRLQIQSAAVADPADDHVNGTGDLLHLSRHGGGHFGIFTVHQAHDILSTEVVDR